MKSPKQTASRGTAQPVITRTEVSSGGVVYRKRGERVDVALIAVGDPLRWQLPKGVVDEGERPEDTAIREVREETGLTATLVAPLERIGYWYQRNEKGARIRVRKFVHFFLLRYRSGSVRNHDHEVSDARWVLLDDAAATLAFASERGVVEKAAKVLRSQSVGG